MAAKVKTPFDSAPLQSLAFGDVGDDATAVSEENPLPMQLSGVKLTPPVSLGAYTLTVDATNAGNGLGTLLGGTVLAAAITAGLSAMLVTVKTFPIQVRFDGGDATAAGTEWAKDNGQPYVWDCADFTGVQLVGVGGTASVKVELFA